MSKIEELINKYCPDGVNYFSINEIATTYNGLSGKNKDDFKNGNAKFITYMNVYKNASTDLSDTSVVRINENEKQNNIKLGDILMTTSSENIEDSGMISVVTKQPEENIYLNSFCFGIRIKDEYLSRFNFDYLKHLFRSKAIRKKIQKCSFGVTRFNLNKNKFLKIRIPVPPMEVQSEIVHILDDFTLLTAKLTAELTARNKQYEYFKNKLLNIEHNQNVEVNEIGEICNIKAGGDKPKEFFSKIKNEEFNIPVIGNGIGKNAIIGYTNEAKISQKAVTIAARGTIGYDEYRDYSYFPIIRLISAIPKDEKILNTKYLYYCLKGRKYQTPKTGIPQLTVPIFSKTKILVPPLKKQERIVNTLDRFDKLTNDINEGLPAEIEARKKQYEYYRDKLLNFKELKEA